MSFKAHAPPRRRHRQARALDVSNVIDGLIKEACNVGNTTASAYYFLTYLRALSCAVEYFAIGFRLTLLLCRLFLQRIESDGIAHALVLVLPCFIVVAGHH